MYTWSMGDRFEISEHYLARARRCVALGASSVAVATGSTEPKHRAQRACSYRSLAIGYLALMLTVWVFTNAGHAQQVDGISVAGKNLQEASGPAMFSGLTNLAPASVSGAVLDADGAMVSGATVTLAATDGTLKRVLLSGAHGEFKFSELPATTFRITITSPGMARFVSSGILLGAGENREIPAIVLAVMGATTQVEVSVTQAELAQEQLKAAEQQRVFGVFPNFYSNYLWDSAPLNAAQKFNLAFHSITDPMEFVGTAIIAGAEQATNSFPGFGQGAGGYAKRYGAAYADDVLGKMIGSALLPSLFHQDPRYFYKGSGSFHSRVFYAVSQAVMTRGDNGHVEPNYSHVLGSLAAGSIANFYYPAGDRGVGLVLGNALLGTAGRAAENLVREFFLRRLTPTVPRYEKGKP